MKTHLDGLFAEEKTVAHVAVKLERKLARWVLRNSLKPTRRCCLCGERIMHRKIIMRPEGPSHWACYLTKAAN